MIEFLDISIKQKISDILNKELLCGKFEDVYNIIDQNLQIGDLNGIFYEFLKNKQILENIGIDLPLSFGDYKPSIHKTFVVALDPKRNNKSNKEQNKKKPAEISIGSIFSLHTEEGKNTGKNNYWEFVSHLTKSGFVYLTDIYKIYYESIQSNGQRLLSNKDEDFVAKVKSPNEQNILILREEIKIIKPNRVITLGKDAKHSVSKIMGVEINDEEIQYFHENIEYIFLPHISTTVTQSIKTIGDLYKGLGLITNNETIKSLGVNLLVNRSVENILK